MAAAQYIFTDGVESVTLDGTDGYAAKNGYTPTAPNLRAQAMSQPGQDGGELNVTYDNVSEQLACYLMGTGARASQSRLSRILSHARQSPALTPVYLKFRPEGSETWYRSQLLAGRAVLSKTALESEIAAGLFQVTCIFTRRYYWETDSEGEVALMAAGDVAPGATGGKTLTNHEDGGHANYVRIAPNQMAGDLPAGCRLELANASGGLLGTLYVSHEMEYGGNAVQATFEGEAALPLSDQVDANASGGHYNRLSWAGSAETDLATWTIPSNEVARWLGRWARALVRCANTFAYTDLYLRLKLLSGGVLLYQTEKQLARAACSVQDLGAVAIPPQLSAQRLGGAPADVPLSVVLQATRLAGGACVLDVDYLQFLPLGQYRKYSHLGSGVAVGASIRDDSMAAATWTLTAGAKALDVSAEGEPILIAPDRILYQKIRCWMERADLTSPIADTLTVRVYARERRLTI